MNVKNKLRKECPGLQVRILNAAYDGHSTLEPPHLLDGTPRSRDRRYSFADPPAPEINHHIARVVERFIKGDPQTVPIPSALPENLK